MFGGLTFVHSGSDHGNFAVHGYPISVVTHDKWHCFRGLFGSVGCICPVAEAQAETVWAGVIVAGR